MKKLTAMDCQIALKRGFAPWIQALDLKVEDVQPGKARLRMPANPAVLRVGDIVCGQALMALADTVMVFAVASTMGEFRPMTTATQNTSFLRPAPAGDLIVEGRVIKSGRSLVFGEAIITAAGNPEPIATATLTLSLPPLKPG
ncbi:MAG: PaaI family thioesterase [Alphaproteobacteria bacterium]|nr:PaaI family thioesterase [Alphaproteobacteria bacterium]